jgi:hypothetical protein
LGADGEEFANVFGIEAPTVLSNIVHANQLYLETLPACAPRHAPSAEHALLFFKVSFRALRMHAAAAY